MKTRNMRKKNKTRKIKGGKITKINDIWTIDPETVESNPTVMKYRTLEVDVLNVLAKNSSSNNSNIVLEHETTIEDNYKKLWFLFNHFDSVIKKPIINTKETNFTIFDYFI